MSSVTAGEDINPTREHETEELASAWRPPRGLAEISAVNQTIVGKRVLVTGFVFFLIGGVMALLMRLQLAVPENDLIGHELYNQLFTMHGTTMLFLFAVPILEGAAVYLLPPMLGARDMAFPRLSAFSYWCYLFGGILLYASLFAGMMPDTGWTMYTPLSDDQYAPGPGVDFWLLGITLVEIGTITAAAEVAVTVLKSRAPGMSLDRLPLFAWYMLVVAFMILIGFPPLIMGDLLLELQRSFDWPFFDNARGGHDLLWQHLFWIFGHPEVYIIFLPAAGLASMIIATFSRRPTAGYFWLVIAAVGTGFFSFGLWVHHMFVTGIPLISLGWFSSASMTVAIFSGIQIFAWIATLWLGKPLLKTPMLFIVGFIFLFVAGGLTGVMHAVIPFDWQTHSTYFLIAHFHYVLFGGMVFPLFAAIYYWFPLNAGRMMSEKIGKWHFWLMFAGFNITFFPMHISGLEGMPRRIYTYPGGSWEWENLVSTAGAILLAISILLFVYNFIRSLRHGEATGPNPWGAGTLEWSMPCPAPPYNFRTIPEVSSRYPLWEQEGLGDGIERGEHHLSNAIGGLRLGTSVSVVTGVLQSIIIYPKPNYSPLVAALGLAALFTGILIKVYWLCGAGAAVSLAAFLAWLWQHPHAKPAEHDQIEAHAGVSVGGEESWWGALMAVIGDAALLVSTVFAYFYLWSQSPDWPPSGAELPGPVWPLAGIAGLLAGSVAVHLAVNRLRSTVAVVSMLLLAAVIGVAYTVLEILLLQETGLAPTTHAYSALIHVLVAFNLLHVGIVLLMLGFSACWLLFGIQGLPARKILRITGLFWHYVVVMGIMVTAVVYLWPLTL